jgi:phosphatidylserine/phosphatidylglycerophosphate/cardiolipin synthase-like enzyme
VKIRILTDRLQAFGKSSKVKLLHDIGFDIKIHSKDRIMHHKFAIFDNQKAVEGSFNWTYSAANKNAEDCNIFDDERDIQTLNKRFKKLWKINLKENSECYFENMNQGDYLEAFCYHDKGSNITLLASNYQLNSHFSAIKIGDIP